MKYIIYIIFFVCFGLSVKAQSGFPSQTWAGWIKPIFVVPDSGSVISKRDTNWIPTKPAMTVTWFHAGVDTTQWFWTGVKWNRVSAAQIDTTSLSNRINLKLNISDTASMLLPYLRKVDTLNKWVQNVYSRNDSLFKLKNGTETFVHIFPTSGSGTVTSIGVSVPTAMSVTPSTITTSGTFNFSGAGLASQYVKGDFTLGTTDTSMIPNFFLKVRSLLSGTSPITYNSTTGIIGILNANSTGQKGAATFNNSDFTDNGSALISLAPIGSGGSCLNCQLTIDTKGRITSFADGSIFLLSNAPGAGDTLVVSGDTIKRIYASYGLISTPTASSIALRVDTTLIQKLITANNGLTKTGNNIQLGGALIQATNITSSVGANRIIYSGVSSFADGAQLDVSTTGSAGIGVRGQTIDGRGIFGVATTGVGVYGTATGTGGYGLFGLSTLGNAIYGRADSGLIWEGEMVPHSNNTIISARSTTRSSQALGANGIGYSDDSYLQTSIGGNRHSHQIIYKLTDATDASYTSSFEFWNANNATLARKMAIAGNGQITLDQYTGTNFQTIDTSFNSLVVDGSGNIFKRAGGSGGGGGNAGDTALYASFNGNTYAEQEVNKQPFLWENLTTNARYQWYDGVSAATVLDTLIVFGGWNGGVSFDSVFQSVDGGITWTYRSNLPYSVHTPAYIPNATDGYTYIIGGDYNNTTSDRAKVYRTRDFKTFELRTSSSPFGTRVLHAAVEFNGNLYCGGGQYYTLNRADGLFTDLYKSTDGGVTWSLVSNSLTFMGKNISGCFRVFDGRMYIVSGGIYDNSVPNKTFDRSVFTSTNGVNWYQLPDSIPFQGLQYPNTYVWDGKLWIAGGFEGALTQNVDSTAFLDKAQKWHVYKPTQLPDANHAAADIVYKDMPLQILGNTTNVVWRLKRNADIWFEQPRTFVKTSIGIDSLRRNSNGYNIEAYSTTSLNENKWTNSGFTNYDQWSGSEYDLLNNGVLTWQFPANGQFYAKKILGSSSSTTFYTGSYFSTSIQTTENFPGIAWSGNSHRFVLGLDGSLVGFRLEDGSVNAIRFKHDISNGQTAFAYNTTNNYDIATLPSAALSITSTIGGFLPPKMTATQRNAITVGRIGGISITNAGSGYTNGTYTPVSLNGGSGTSATATIVVSGNVISSVTISLAGSNYLIGDVLTVNASDVGGTGSGAQFTITAIQERGLLVFDTDSGRFSGYTNGWKMIAWTTDGGGSATTIYNGDGTLSGNRSISGGTNTLQLGTSGSKISTLTSNVSTAFTVNSDSKINLLGAIIFNEKRASDADYTVTATDEAIRLPSITSNRNLVINFNIADTGKILTIFNENNSANTWSFNTNPVVNSQGGPVTTIENNTNYVLQYVGIDGGTAEWRILSINGYNPVKVSSSGTVTMAYSIYPREEYVATGTTATYTLPTVSSTKVGFTFSIKNRGSGNVTVNTNGGGNDIYDTSAVNTLTVAAGGSIDLMFDGTYFVTKAKQ